MLTLSFQRRFLMFDSNKSFKKRIGTFLKLILKNRFLIKKDEKNFIRAMIHFIFKAKIYQLFWVISFLATLFLMLFYFFFWKKLYFKANFENLKTIWSKIAYVITSSVHRLRSSGLYNVFFFLVAISFASSSSQISCLNSLCVLFFKT